MLPKSAQPHRSFAVQTRPNNHRGVVLIISLIMLVIISLLTALSVRLATSSEAVSGNIRQTLTANQVTEAALRYCESAVINLISSGTQTFNFTSPPSSTSIVFDAPYILDTTPGTTPTSLVAANWDSTSASNRILVLPSTLSYVNGSGTNTLSFNRPPECMVERLQPTTALDGYSNSFAITARGFGPEVAAADSSRSRPVGTEVWIQSTLEFN